MKKHLRVAGVGLSFALLASTTLAQRPRIGDPPKTGPQPGATTVPVSDTTKAAVSVPNPAPMQPVKVKYEGGYFGYNQKMDGTLYLDHLGERLVFRNKAQKELFAIPYSGVMAAYADTQSRRPAAASVIGSAVPYGLGLPALLIKKKYRYMNLQFNDPDMGLAGVTSFKFENKEIFASILQTVADETGLAQRGEIFVRKRAPRPDTDQQ